MGTEAVSGPRGTRSKREALAARTGQLHLEGAAVAPVEGGEVLEGPAFGRVADAVEHQQRRAAVDLEQARLPGAGRGRLHPAPARDNGQAVVLAQDLVERPGTVEVALVQARARAPPGGRSW